MAAVDFRSAYELLRRVMEQQELERQGTGYGSTAGAPAAADPSSYGSPQGGLLGRLIDLQAAQRAYQPYPRDGGAAPSEPQNPNFRKLTRVDVQPQGAVAPSDDQSGSSDYLIGTTLDAPRTNPQGAGLFGLPGYMPAPRWGVPLAGGVTLPFPGKRGIPFPPIGPGSVTEIPKSAVPDVWKHAATILQMIPGYVAGLADSDVSDLPSSPGGMTILQNKKRRGIEEWLEDREAKRKAQSLVPHRLVRDDQGHGDDFCGKRRSEEESKCEKYQEDVAHPHHYSGCIDRAKIRWDICNRNKKRRRKLDEVPEWEPGEDDHVWFNTDR